VVVALFCFQLSRVYLVNKIDVFYNCPNTQVWTSSSSSDNSAEAADSSADTLAAVISSEQDDRNYVRSCKDTLDGLGLSPVQPLGIPVAIFPQKPVANWVNPAATVDAAPERYLPPLFQPPRSLI
jgi:hypothetical protein